MKVLVCGSRDWKDRQRLYEYLDNFHDNYNIDVVVHGAAIGADLMAEDWAKSRELQYHGYPAKWKTYHKAAGPIRNRLQYDTDIPDAVIAFHEDLENSSGTKDMVNYAKERGCKHVFLITLNDASRL